MSLIVDGIRPSWLPGINNVTGKQTVGIADWLLSGDYQIYTQITPDSVELTVADTDKVTAAFAADAARYGMAAVESMEGIGKTRGLPKSTGWLAIRSYYAAFFAAHSLMRVVGASCTQLDAPHAKRINALADAFGMSNGVKLAGGLFESKLDVAAKKLRLDRVDPQGGSHVATWRVFVREWRNIQLNAVQAGLLAADLGAVVAKMVEIEQTLSDRGGLISGAWMSQIRNRVNYRLEFRAWFPYGDSDEYYTELFSKVKLWKKDPLTYVISAKKGRELHRLVETAAALVAISTDVSQDIADRCPKGKSFQSYACMSLLNQLSA